ncbi:hypothetical protein LAZ67_11000535 [Cordylochernes scorpioides]|uniref:Mariner Mos1 transposase n=1 Tax=Cordylochernes scorpioides TaxID=51811 RepID=A0ABY6KXY5_9ARAC|nr:hypothetical protein LAZ67_11000535 [Cordylochernes scorpioides]
MFRSMTHGLAEQHFTSYEEAKNWVNVWVASKVEDFFRHGIRICCLKDGKKSSSATTATGISMGHLSIITGLR